MIKWVECIIQLINTIPYDWGGLCKHIVALLLAWVHEPETFHALAPLGEMLAGRRRENYWTAAALLVCIRDLYRQQDDQALWERYIADLRQGYQRLPALQDELNRAGL